MQRSSKTAVLRFSVVLILLAVFAWVASSSVLIRENIGNRDSISYWATGYLLVRHQNPYDPGAVLGLEQGVGHREARPAMLRVPPWALALIAPLGLLDACWAWFTWFCLSIAAFVFSVRSCRGMFCGSEAVAADCNLAAYLFAPVLACLEAGQIGFFLLLGLVLFLRWEAKRPFLAGAALLLPFAKPHLFLPLGVVCVLWIVWRRRWAILAGFAAALMSCVAIAFWFDPAVFMHYRAMLNQQAIGGEFIPTLPGLFRLLVARQLFWVQFVPAVVGLGWAGWYWALHRREWNWHEHGLLVLLLSVLMSPYGWLTDEVVLLPVVFQAAAWIFGNPISARAAKPITALIALNAVLLVVAVAQVPLPSGAYLCSGLLWAAWYGIARRWASTQALNAGFSSLQELVREN